MEKLEEMRNMEKIENIDSLKENGYLKKVNQTIKNMSKHYSLPFDIDVTIKDVPTSYAYFDYNQEENKQNEQNRQNKQNKQDKKKITSNIVLARITNEEKQYIGSESLYYTGLCVHEIGHLIYSDFNVLNDIKKKHTIALKQANDLLFKTVNKQSLTHKMIASAIENLICATIQKPIFYSLEDGFIENALLNDAQSMYSISPALVYVRKLNLKEQYKTVYNLDNFEHFEHFEHFENFDNSKKNEYLSLVDNTKNSIDPILNICNEILMISTDETYLINILNYFKNSKNSKNSKNLKDLKNSKDSNTALALIFANSVLFKRHSFEKIVYLIANARYNTANSYERNAIAENIVECIRPYIKQKSKKAASMYMKLHKLPVTINKWFSDDIYSFNNSFDNSLNKIENLYNQELPQSVIDYLQNLQNNAINNANNKNSIDKDKKDENNIDTILEYLINKYNDFNTSNISNNSNISNISKISSIAKKYEASSQYNDDIILDNEQENTIYKDLKSNEYKKANIIYIDENKYSSEFQLKLKNHNYGDVLKKEVLSNVASYNKECVKIAKQIKNEIVQKQKDITRKGLDHGNKLNTSSLYRANIDGKIFQSIKKGQNPNVVVSILIDTSSSMASSNKLEIAVKKAYMIARVLQMLNIPFSINTHSTYNGKVMYNKLVPFGKNKNVNTLNGLFDLYAYGDTKEYEAIEETLKNLVNYKKDNQQGIIYVISDGMYDQKNEIEQLYEVYSKKFNIVKKEIIV